MTADQLRAEVKARREAAGLVLTVIDGEDRITLYPKDRAQLMKWVEGYRAKGLKVIVKDQTKGE